MNNRTEMIAEEIWNILSRDIEEKSWGGTTNDIRAQFRRAARAAEMAAHVWDSRMPLSPRQREVLEWAARGKTAKEISKILGVTYGTVREHRDLAVSRLDAVNLTYAVALAVSKGFVSIKEYDPCVEKI